MDFKHYRCGVSLYFLSLLPSNFNITIVRIIGVLGHWKDIMDAINDCDKRYMKENMCVIGTLEADDSTKRMEAHIMVGKIKSNWTITYKKLLEDNIGVHGVKCYNKHG